MAMTDIKINQTDIDDVAVHVSVTGDRLSGTVLQNKEVFDKFPQMVADHFNDLCDYIETISPEGDAGLSYTATEIAFMCGILGCAESDITL